MTEKMLKLNFPTNWSYPLYESFNFYHVGPTGSDEVQLKTTDSEGFHTCREFFCRNMRYKYERNSKNNGIFTGRTYALINFRRVDNPTPAKIKDRYRKMKRKLSKSLAYLNCLEREYGWPLSKMYPVENSKKPNSYTCLPSYVFIGSGRWNTSPYMLSLYTLLLRGCYHAWIPAPKKNWEDTRKALLKKATFSSDGDCAKIARTINYWHIFLKYHSRLWAGHSKSWHWAASRLTNPSMHRSEGIHRLCIGTTKCGYAQRKFIEIKSEEGLS